tara:strand:- start:334 stop:807 length:474 start_codon:yes stop_codon:yes gene_type:complete
MSLKGDYSKNIQVLGLDNINKILTELIPREANNLSKAMVFGFAQHASKLVKKRAPVGKTSNSGNLKKAIKAKRMRSLPGLPKSKVVITKGNFVKNDAFYWRFVEYGTGGKNQQPARAFVRPAILEMRAQIDGLVEDIFTKKLAAAVKRAKKKAAKRG